MMIGLQTNIKLHWPLLPLLFITTFGLGFQAIPLCAWFYIPTILLYTRQKPSVHIGVVYIVSSIGSSLGFLGCFQTISTGPRFPRGWAIILASFVINLTLIVILLTEKYVIRRLDFCYVRVFVFPCVWTAAWFLVARFGPLGDYVSWTTVLADWRDFSQLASLGGRAILDFLFAISGTVAFEIESFPVQLFSAYTKNDFLADSTAAEEYENQHEDNSNTFTLKKPQFISLLLHPITLYTLIMTLALTYGGLKTNIRSGSFYQVNYPDYIPRKEPVGCVVGPNNYFPDLRVNHDLWFNKSSELADAGAKLIIWSESTTLVENERDEKLFIERTKAFAKLRNIYIGVTYNLIQPVEKNKFVFVTNNGQIAINYNKAHPVPGIESQPAGESVLQYVDTEEFGRVGGGICFDYNFPDFIKQASAHKVDVMLQPSWTWGPIGTHHQQGNILRPVENGFTLFRCVSEGVSGIFEPTLNSILTQKVASLNVEKLMFYLPIQKRVSTLYGLIGDSFSYVCIVATFVIILFAYRNGKKQHQLTI